MGKNNVAGRLTKCGQTPVLYTYPAWTFPGKRKDNDSTDGPGPGGFKPGLTFGSIGPGFGPPPRRSRAEPHGPRAPGALPQPSRGPAYSFGLPRRHHASDNPGPAQYSVGAWPHDLRVGASWGPPPADKPEPPLRPLRVEEPILRRSKGPTFGLPHRQLPPTGVPGPNAYRVCDGCCQACQGYHGPSFGLRPPTMYGSMPFTPGPANYHTECSSLGAATQNCATGASTFRAPRPSRRLG